ncbi:MAG: LacI family DNA-binding transcriptional regulator [Desulfovibrionaceae bacterium]|nr:LacI family DNA-binding transcriptional regulator [Desulfovibrionaceae bacterium]
MSKRVTLADLKEKTGLSQATISMILAKRNDVSFPEETVRLVQDAARELGYVPVTRKQVTLFSRNTILVVCPFTLNYSYSTIVQTIQRMATSMGCNTLVYTTYGDTEEERRILKVMAESDVGGAIFAMMPHSKALLQKTSTRMPVVVIADPDDTLSVSCIKLHNYYAGSLLAQHLLSLGHTHIACISTPLSVTIPARVRRFEGLRDTWKQHCPHGEVQLFTSFVRQEEKRELMLERKLGRDITFSILDNEPKRFTAFVAINDMLAYGVLDALHELKRKVPEEYSVCGCDNDFPSDLAGVSLTSVEHFMAQNAELSFLVLYDMMQQDQKKGVHPSTDIAAHKNIQPELIIRHSSGKPRTTSSNVSQYA